MSTIFISHSSKDGAAASELKASLDQHGLRSLFLDFDPEVGIPAGRNWEQELYRQLRACQAVIVLCSEHSMTSDWCFVEMTHARALGKNIFPMRIAPCTVRPPLTELQVIDAVTDHAAAYEKLLQGLRLAGIEDAFPWDTRRPPYPGLTTFTEADAAVFFGRDADIRAGLDALNRVGRFGGAQFVVYLGASGSGKSSLLRAGVLPRLAQNTQTWLVVDAFRPTQKPLDEMAMAIAQLRRDDKAPDWNTVSLALNAIADAAVPAVGAAHLLRDLRQAAGGNRTIVFTVDQFEEALVDSREATRFLRVLAAIAVDPDRQAFVLATLRSDFFSSMQTHPALQGMAFDTLSVGRLPVDGLVHVIEGPAQVAGLDIETGLTQLMLADADTDDSLPLVAFTLRELWEHDGKQGRLTIATYRDVLGGLTGAIARAAEAVLSAQTLTPQEDEDLRSAFLAMVRINDAGQYTRQAVRWNDLPERSRSSLERFIAARLLVSGSDGKDRVVEVAHEALFRVWKRAKDWLDADRDNLRLREGLRSAAREWDERGRPADLLLHRGTRLEAAEVLVKQARFQLDALTREYLAACVEVRDAELAAEARRIAARRRAAYITIASLAVGLIVASALGAWAWGERRQATDRLASLHWVNGVTERDQNHDPLKALHHFAQAFALTNDPADARNAHLAADLIAGNAELASILPPPGGVKSATFTSDPARIVTWDNTGTARVWDIQSRQSREPPLHEASAVKLIASPHGTRVALVMADRALEVRDAESGRVLVSAPANSGDPVFSDDDVRVATIDGNVVRVWDESSATAVASLTHPARVLGAALSARGEHALTWDDQATARLWNVKSGETAGDIKLTAPIVSGVVSADAKRVLLWGRSTRISLWRPDYGSRVDAGPADAATIETTSAAFFPSGNKVLAWNYGGAGTACIVDSESGKELARFRHEGMIRNASFNRAETRVLTSSDDGTARLSSAANGAQLATFVHDDEVRGASFSPDETRMLTWSEDGTARIWDAMSGEPLSLPLLHEGHLVGAAFGADGRFVLTWDGRAARVWRQRPDAERRVYTLVHRASLLAATLTANEDEIVTLTHDGVVHRWNKDQETEPQLALPRKLVGATFDAKGERIAGWTGDHTVGIFNARNAHDLVGPMRHDASDLGIRGVLFNGDGSRVMSFGDDKTARVWDSVSGKLLATLSHPAGVNGVAPSRDDAQVLTWSADNTVRLWNVADQQIAAKLPAFDYGVVGATMTRDSARIVTWDEDGGIRVFNASDGTLQRTLSEGTGIAVKGVVFSADERRLLIFDERSIRIQDADDKASHAPVAWDSGEANRAVFTHDGTRVLSWGGAGARLWEARTGQPLTSWLARKGTITGARLSDDERTLIVYTDAVVRSFDVGVDDIPDARAYALAQQIRTGTRLSPMGRVEVIPATEWRSLGPVATPARSSSEARATVRP